MSASKAPKASWKREFFQFFGSLQLAIVLLLLIAAGSIIGTVLPQDQGPGVIHNATFHPLVKSALLALQAHDVYHAAWFQAFVNNRLTNQRSFVYMTIYGLLVVFFAYFYTAIAFNPVDTADNLRKYGGFVPGIRPGPPTADYLSFVLTRITLPGSLYLALIALLPSIVFAFWVIQSFPFGGTSLLITVGVALETMKQLESQLLMRHYEGFLK